jgi:ubiquinone/menaquinone biosynthesis C-methylase UbiE
MTQPIDYYAEGSLSALAYDFVEGALQGTKGDLDFYLEQARETGGPVLDVGSGTGRITWPLAEAGYDIVGIDRAAAMLRLAEAKRANRPDASRRARFLEQDMTRLDLGERFRLIVVSYFTFQYLLDPADQRAALTALRRHLAPGGRLVMHLFDPPDHLFTSVEAFERTRHINVLDPRTGAKVRWRAEERTVDALAQCLYQVISYRVEAADGTLIRESREMLAQRWSFQQELRYLFELTGLRVEALYSDFSKSPPATGRYQIWLLNAV